ncbi:hypothetical protein [Algoriphagus limi]|uniref:Uncharacterized protein n=1 Tax=Algoriphagus limi TaxID=2975273 RepID=A0ABT2G4I4_9BACT|nr:hypothetical protein [Algoriphagus limi]MCS5490183.1 hypothetical protein [Algoriphagus limi]
MKKQIILTSLGFLLCVVLVNAQDISGKSFNKKGYQAWVKLKDSSIIHGLLWNVDSSFIEIKTDDVKGWKNPESNAPLKKIQIQDIQSIETKKVRAVLKGYGWGAIIGNSLGLVAAGVAELSWPENDGHMLLVPMFGLTGSFIGLIGGAANDKKFEIGGNSGNLEANLPELSKRAFWK